MSDLFEEPETMASYERLIEAGLDQRIAFMTAATDAAFRHECKPAPHPLKPMHEASASWRGLMRCWKDSARPLPRSVRL